MGKRCLCSLDRLVETIFLGVGHACTVCYEGENDKSTGDTEMRMQRAMTYECQLM